MKRLFVKIVICLIFIGCSKVGKDKLEIPDLIPSEVNKDKLEIPDLIPFEQNNENTNQVHISNDILLPKMELSRENIYAEFPKVPDYFIENDIAVTIKRIDNRLNMTPSYYGLEPVYVEGENFFIIYSTDNFIYAADIGYEIKRVDLEGKSIFSYWNPFFDATWDDVKESWGEPSIAYKGEIGYHFYDVWYYYVAFEYDSEGKIIKIGIGDAP